LRLRYSDDLKTRNNCSLGSLGTPAHNVWEGDGNERVVERERVMDLLGSLSIGSSAVTGTMVSGPALHSDEEFHPLSTLWKYST
jgi:hypothetical protein